ncbi:DoxX family protein [Pedobacter foliorum]|uniref:DoxX family protein n=1 Tax=Pedobacter foliorum TaxID=2739058 RepID=UPI001567C273|nr:DoxX family protein [Pedobacter foliorum]NRF38026.1 DoxX family protein [Pedobacter foliorum]
MLKTLLTSKALFENWLVLIRVISGLLIFVHGLGTFNKGHMDGNVAWLTDIHFPAPVLMAYIGKGAELIGGILLMLGLFTRIAALILIIDMLVISTVLGNGKIFTDDQHPFLLLLLFVYLFFIGSGKISLDHLLFNKNKN